MYGSSVFDIDGNSYFVKEQGDIGFIQDRIKAVRLDSSVYMDIDGKVYAENRNNCSKYATNEWFNWARRKMLSLGFRPNF